MNKYLAFIVVFTLPCLLGAMTLRDPTEPPGYQGSDNSKNPFELNAIFIHPKQRFAIINGTQMIVGDQIGEYIITTITPNAVELGSNGKNTEVLHLFTSVKQAS